MTADAKPVARFRTRVEELNSDAARFYFSDQSEAAAFALAHGRRCEESSPPCAGGGLWCVAVPYTVATVDILAKVGSVEFCDGISAGIELGKEMQESPHDR